MAPAVMLTWPPWARYPGWVCIFLAQLAGPEKKEEKAGPGGRRGGGGSGRGGSSKQRSPALEPAGPLSDDPQASLVGWLGGGTGAGVGAGAGRRETRET